MWEVCEAFIFCSAVACSHRQACCCTGDRCLWHRHHRHRAGSYALHHSNCEGDFAAQSHCVQRLEEDSGRHWAWGLQNPQSESTHHAQLMPDSACFHCAANHSWSLLLACLEAGGCFWCIIAACMYSDLMFNRCRYVLQSWQYYRWWFLSPVMAILQVMSSVVAGRVVRIIG